MNADEQPAATPHRYETRGAYRGNSCARCGCKSAARVHRAVLRPDAARERAFLRIGQILNSLTPEDRAQIMASIAERFVLPMDDLQRLDFIRDLGNDEPLAWRGSNGSRIAVDPDAKVRGFPDQLDVLTGGIEP